MDELYVDSVDHRFGDRQILNNVYLKCKIGEVVGVLGRNGSGKSTLLKVIFGELSPRHKHLKIDGVFTLKGYLSNQIAYLPQNFFIPQYLTLRILLQLYSRKYTEQLMQIDVFKTNINERIGNLSGGNRRLVEALLILYSDAKYVLLDEPFSQLAPLIAAEIKEHLAVLKSTKGFIVTDHHYRQILEVADRVILIHNGSDYNISNDDDLRLHGYLPS